MASFTLLFDSWQRELKDPKEDFSERLEELRTALRVAEAVCPAYMIAIDYRTMKMAYVDSRMKSLSGHEPERFYKEGPDFILGRYHPEDLSEVLVLQKMAAEQLLELTFEERKTFELQFVFRWLTSDEKTYRWIFTTLRPFIFDQAGNVMVDVLYSSALNGVHREEFDWSMSWMKNGKLMVRKDTLLPAADLSRLTAAEKNILRYLRSGMSSKEIAEQLNVSKFTVDTHRRNLLAKTGAKNSAELMKLTASLLLS